MKKIHQKTQIILISVGIFLILATYFFYPYMKKTQLAKSKSIQEDVIKSLDEDKETTFTEIQYKGIYAPNKNFTVSSQEAHIMDSAPNLVHMKGMKVLLYLSANRIVIITSDFGRYQKKSHDLWFESNVVASDQETKIFAENLDLLATENIVKIYNNVIIDSPTGSLSADTAVYDFETKYMKVGMFGDKTLKMKVIK